MSGRGHGQCFSREIMYKIRTQADQQILIDAYRALERDQAKDGKPYIIKVDVRRLPRVPHPWFYTVRATVDFKSLEDLKYFDDECPANKALKNVVWELMLKDYTGEMVTRQSDAVLPASS